jgi:Flp pilus assembly protein TadB
MKFPQLFTKIPKHKRFGYTPRHYDPQEEERRERELRIRQELIREGKIESEREAGDGDRYQSRIAGSFRNAKRTTTAQSDPSANMLRLIITLILCVGLIAFLQFGKNALIGVALVFIPFYLYLKFRKSRR